MPNPNAQLHHPTEGRAVESVPASTAVCHPFVEPYEFSVPKVFLRGSARSMGLAYGIASSGVRGKDLVCLSTQKKVSIRTLTGAMRWLIRGRQAQAKDRRVK
nr:PREDICTED: uncharacterized protein LOC108952303 [Musa acuminata subsp. malaccensis]